MAEIAALIASLVDFDRIIVALSKGIVVRSMIVEDYIFVLGRKSGNRLCRPSIIVKNMAHLRRGSVVQRATI